MMLVCYVYRITAGGVNQTIGTYFQARSELPPQIGDPRGSLFPSTQFKARSRSQLPPQIGDPARNRSSFNNNTNLSSTRESTNRDPRESLTTFFLSATSNQLNSQSIMNTVMKYCREKQTTEHAIAEQKSPEEPPKQLRMKEDRFSEGVGIMDITAVSEAPSSPPYSPHPHHSTPKRKSSRASATSTVTAKDKQKTMKEMLDDLEKVQLKPHRETGGKKSVDKLAMEKMERTERTISPNSSISSSATAVSNNAGTQCQVQIYRAQSTSSINLPLPTDNTHNHNIPIVIQVQCPCSHNNNHRKSSIHKNAHEGCRCSPNAVQPTQAQAPAPVPVMPAPAPQPNVQFVPYSYPYHRQPYMMVPMMVMPYGMPMPAPGDHPPQQAQYQAPQNNTQCQCGGNSSHK